MIACEAIRIVLDVWRFFDTLNCIKMCSENIQVPLGLLEAMYDLYKLLNLALCASSTFGSRLSSLAEFKTVWSHVKA